MSLTSQFIADLQKFMRKTGMSLTVFGLRAANNSHAVKNWINKTHSPKLDSVDRVYKFMDNYTEDKK